MGMEYDAIKHINLVQERCNTVGIENIVVEPEDFMKYSKRFLLLICLNSTICILI